MKRIPGEDTLAGCGVVFEAGDPPRTGRIGFYGDVDSEVGEPGTLTVVVSADGATRTVPARFLPVADALGVLRRITPTHPAAAFWSRAVLEALRLVAAGRLLPSVSAGGFDAWRAGPVDPDRFATLVAAMPVSARAVPVADGTLVDAGVLVRGFFDAVADVLPRSAAAPAASGADAFAGWPPRKIPALRSWSDEVSAGLDSAVAVSLRLELADLDLTAVVQVHGPTVVDARDLWTDPPPGFGGRARIDTTLAIRRAARVWPALEPLLHREIPDRVRLADDEVGHLIGLAPALAAAGVEVHWPKELDRDLSARAVVGRGTTDLPSLFGAKTLLAVDWRLALGDSPLTDAELDVLAEAQRPVVRLRDRWVLLDPELAKRARDRQLTPLRPIDAVAAALTGVVEIHGERVDVVSDGVLETLRARLTDESDDPVDVPAALNASLRDYQVRGLRWLARMTDLGLGACLADDMGLGKTITLIALHLHRCAGPTLVVCPASLLGNWEREITRFAPGTPVRRFHGSSRELSDVDSGFVLTTYGTMRVDTDTLAAHPWGLVVADEAQHVKNPASGTAKALRRIPAPARVALTGTPVENNLSELWSILDWTTPGLLGSLAGFRTRYGRPIEADQDRDAADRLARLVRPFLLRRRKSDPGIAPELPPKTETDRPVALSAEQAGLYEAVVRETMAEIRGSNGMARRGLVMTLLTALKQICNHPAQYLKRDTTGRSGKLDALDELLDTILAENGAVLVFTQYVAMAKLIEKHLVARGIGTQLLHGGTPVPKREELVERFQDGAVPVFLLSLKAAGTGLNLTAADHVVHYDRWWNPAVEDQATDRAYRIGQTRPVQVHRLIAEGTVEDRIAEMLAGKRELADSVLAGGETALTELSDDDLADLVELRGAR